MKDKDIRKLLIEYLTKDEHQMFGQGVSLNEVSICWGNTRVDVLHVSDRMIGFEIKSDRDNYNRLSRQVPNYDRVCDECYLVVGAAHIHTMWNVVPEHWGIIVIDEIGVDIYREASENPNQNQLDVLELLWKAEVIELLKECGQYTGMSGKRMKQLNERALLNIGYGHIHEFVLNKLKTRQWITDKSRF